MNITNEVKVSFQEIKPEIKPEKALNLKDANYMTWYVVENTNGETFTAIKTYSAVAVEPPILLINNRGQMLWLGSDGSNYKVLNESAEINIKVYAQ